jgi:hypothetical protein
MMTLIPQGMIMLALVQLFLSQVSFLYTLDDLLALHMLLLHQGSAS